MADRFQIVVIASLLFGVAAPQTVNADTITITSGSVTVAWDDPPFFNFQGSDFHLFSGFFLVPLSPQQTCFSGCAPGTAVNLTTVIGDGPEGGPGRPFDTLGQAQIAVVNGITFAAQGQPDTWLALRGRLFFDALEVIVPPALPENAGERAVFLTTPFVLHGQVMGFRAPFSPSLFEVTLAGRGTAALRLVDADGLWRFPEVSFSFQDQAPVPEPMSILLTGSGLAGLLLRRRSRLPGNPRRRNPSVS